MTTSTFYAVKGGSGTTTVAVMAAVAASANGPTLLIDAGGGDCSPALGVGGQPWTIDAYPVTAELDLLTIVASTTGLAARLRSTSGYDTVIVDAGTTYDPGSDPVHGRLIMVARPDSLTMRRATHATVRPDAIVLITEIGRILQPGDVAASIGAPVIATIDIDTEIIRMTDAGLMHRRVPRTAASAIATVIATPNT